MSRRLVILGGGAAGLALALQIENDKKLSKIIEVILIDKKDYFEVNLGSVRFLVDPKDYQNYSGQYTTYLKKSRFVWGEVITVEAQPQRVEVRTHEGGVEQIPYDYLVVALGTRYPYFKAEAPTREIRKEEITQHAQLVRDARAIIIAGGRSVGLEILGEIINNYPNKEITVVHPANNLMDEWNKSGVNKLNKYLEKHKNINVVLKKKLVRSDGTRHELSDGSFIDADLKITATGNVPNSEPLRQFLGHVLSASGYLKVQKTLQVEGYTNIFAIGDITDIPDSPKMAANTHGHVMLIVKNLKSILSNKEPAPVGPPMMKFPALLTLGPSYAILALPIFGGSSFSGKSLSKLKSSLIFQKAKNPAK